MSERLITIKEAAETMRPDLEGRAAYQWMWRNVRLKNIPAVKIGQRGYLTEADMQKILTPNDESDDE